MSGDAVLTIEIKMNGRIVAEAELTDRAELAMESDYALRWVEYGDDGLGIAVDRGRFLIERHRRPRSVWALVTKACLVILNQKIAAMDAKP
jgi:hypothetical protein